MEKKEEIVFINNCQFLHLFSSLKYVINTGVDDMLTK